MALRLHHLGLQQVKMSHNRAAEPPVRTCRDRVHGPTLIVEVRVRRIVHPQPTGRSLRLRDLPHPARGETHGRGQPAAIQRVPDAFLAGLPYPRPVCTTVNQHQPRTHKNPGSLTGDRSLGIHTFNNCDGLVAFDYLLQSSFIRPSSAVSAMTGQPPSVAEG